LEVVVNEEKLKAIEDMLSGESNYHHVMVTGEAVDAWSIDVGTLRELVAIARLMNASDVYPKQVFPSEEIVNPVVAECLKRMDENV
jgi:hypothetical protein